MLDFNIIDSVVDFLKTAISYFIVIVAVSYSYSLAAVLFDINHPIIIVFAILIMYLQLSNFLMVVSTTATINNY